MRQEGYTREEALKEIETFLQNAQQEELDEIYEITCRFSYRELLLVKP